MKALITGGAGFIGSHLAERLLEQDHSVTVIDDLSTGSHRNIAHITDHPNFQLAVESITNEMVMDRLVSECDVIYHLAAAVGVYLIVSDPVHVIETNVLGTRGVLKLANRYRKKVMIASTSEIYGKSSQIPFREEDDRVLGPTTKSRWSYSTSKAVDEFLGLAYHRQFDVPVVVFRLFNTVGPRQTGHYGMVVPRFAEQAYRGEPITVYGDGLQSRCFCDVEDVVEAIIGLTNCREAVGEVFNIGSSSEVTILQLAEKVLRAADAAKGTSSDEGPSAVQDGRIVMVPYEEAYEAGFEDMRRRVPETSKIRQATGWEPQHTLEDTLDRIVKSLQVADVTPSGETT